MCYTSQCSKGKAALQSLLCLYNCIIVIIKQNCEIIFHHPIIPSQQLNRQNHWVKNLPRRPLIICFDGTWMDCRWTWSPARRRKFPPRSKKNLPVNVTFAPHLSTSPTQPPTNYSPPLSLHAPIPPREITVFTRDDPPPTQHHLQPPESRPTANELFSDGAEKHPILVQMESKWKRSLHTNDLRAGFRPPPHKVGTRRSSARYDAQRAWCQRRREVRLRFSAASANWVLTQTHELHNRIKCTVVAHLIYWVVNHHSCDWGADCYGKVVHWNLFKHRFSSPYTHALTQLISQKGERHGSVQFKLNNFIYPLGTIVV